MTVREIRKITGLSQAAFAAKYEIPTRTVEDWEAGARKPAPYLVKLLERAVCEDYDVKVVIGPVSGTGSGGRGGEGGLCVPAPGSGGSGRDRDGAVITIPCSDPMYSYIKNIVDEWGENGFGFRKSVPGEKADEA